MADPLEISPALRPWLQAGLSVLLFDSTDRVVALKAAPQACPPASTRGQPRAETQNSGSIEARRTGQAPGSPPARQPDNTRSTPSGFAPAPPSHALGTEERVGNQRGGSAQTTLDNEHPGKSTTFPAGCVLPPEAWPPTWLALKNRRPLPSRPLVFWTYAGLGQDLMGTPDPVRQQVIVRILTALRHPGGTHVFWPYALPDAEFSEGDQVPSLFWSGVGLMRPRAILLFGSEARDALNMPKSLMPYCQERVDGRLIIQLPQPAALAETQGQGMGDESFRRALAFLGRLLNFCVAPRVQGI